MSHCGPVRRIARLTITSADAPYDMVRYGARGANRWVNVELAIVWIVVAIVGGLVVFGLSRLIAKSPGFPRL